MRMPEISLDGTTLSFQPYHSEYIINIVQDGEVMFTSVNYKYLYCLTNKIKVNEIIIIIISINSIRS